MQTFKATQKPKKQLPNNSNKKKMHYCKTNTFLTTYLLSDFIITQHEKSIFIPNN